MDPFTDDSPPPYSSLSSCQQTLAPIASGALQVSRYSHDLDDEVVEASRRPQSPHVVSNPPRPTLTLQKHRPAFCAQVFSPDLALTFEGLRDLMSPYRVRPYTTAINIIDSKRQFRSGIMRTRACIINGEMIVRFRVGLRASTEYELYQVLSRTDSGIYEVLGRSDLAPCRHFTASSSSEKPQTLPLGPQSTFAEFKAFAANHGKWKDFRTAGRERAEVSCPYCWTDVSMSAFCLFHPSSGKPMCFLEISVWQNVGSGVSPSDPKWRALEATSTHGSMKPRPDSATQTVHRAYVDAQSSKNLDKHK